MRTVMLAGSEPAVFDPSALVAYVISTCVLPV